MGVFFDGLKPIIKSENIRFDIIESYAKKEYAHLKIQITSDAPEECEFRVQLHIYFYFGFIEIKDDGTIIELDYYDDFCQK